MSLPVFQQVEVQASARLHMGFYDLQSNGRFGSVGLALDAPETHLILASGDAIGNDREADAILARVCEALHINEPVQVAVHRAIPRHVGLGSGTQLAMAMGAGLNALLNLGLTIQEIVQVAGRGRRSGIGVATFAQGGFLVDAGRGTDDAAPSVMERLDFPEQWRVVLVTDSAHIGVHGSAEKQAFQVLDPAIGNLREMIFSRMLPAFIRQDLPAFGICMAELQAYNGAYFSPVQGGQYASKDVEQVLQWFKLQGVMCVGQSSWGPTGFAIVEDDAFAQHLCSQSQSMLQHKPNISVSICRGRNHGALVRARQTIQFRQGEE